MNVSDPTDRPEMSYAIEAIIKEASANDMDNGEIVSVLESYVEAAEKDRYPFNEL